MDELVGFWKLLHRHQSSVAPAVPGLTVLSEADSKALLRAAGIALPDEVLVKDRQGLGAAVARAGCPLVM